MPEGGKVTPIPSGIIARITQAARYVISGVGPETWFGPMQPLQPMAPPEVVGRKYDYPVGYNLNYTPRVPMKAFRSRICGHWPTTATFSARSSRRARTRWRRWTGTSRLSRMTRTSAKLRPRISKSASTRSPRSSRAPTSCNSWQQWLRQCCLRTRCSSSMRRAFTSARTGRVTCGDWNHLTGVP